MLEFLVYTILVYFLCSNTAIGFLDCLDWRGGGYNLALPIGISFYTFQVLSYVVDVYRGECGPQTNMLDLGLYVSFFPQLIAGPIVRYKSIALQLKRRKHSFDDYSEGAWRFTIGLSKKVLLANQVAPVAEKAFLCNRDDFSVGFAWIGAIAYTLQIYFDFSGYSDMAIGLGRIFGFKFSENFNYPYAADSITDFWKRWHISLSAWFRDYVYIPLGGSRVTVYRHIMNLGIVWILTGIWHGANFTFILWGILYFFVLILEKYVVKPEKRSKNVRALYRLFSIVFIILNWVIFNSESVQIAGEYIKTMFSFGNKVFWNAYGTNWTGQYKAFLICAAVLAFPVVPYIKDRAENQVFLRVISGMLMIGLLLLDLCFVISGGYNPFLYYNF